jgi:hypothetical protein
LELIGLEKIVATLVIKTQARQKSFLNKYLLNQEKFLRTKINSEEVREELEAFSKSISKIDEKISDFLKVSDTSLSILCLGQIQSGKTAHLMGSIALAGDTGFDLTIVLTGLTKPLNNQTVERIQKDLNFDQLKHFDVPSSIKSREFKLFFQIFKEELKSDKNENYHVFTVLKSKARLSNLDIILVELRRLKPNLSVLFIDDEADIGSQNSKARKKSEAVLYKKIYGLREIPKKNALLSYTATPQAILLTESMGKLRPDYCVTIDPKLGYFGLTNLLSKDFAEQIVEIDDWHPNKLSQNISPRSLDLALVDFILTHMFRKFFPSCFYSQIFNGAELKDNMISVQMMIHQSSKQKDHYSIYNLARNRINDFFEIISNFDDSENSLELMNNSIWGYSYNKFLSRLPSNTTNLPMHIDLEILKCLKSISKPEFRVINSDSSLEKELRTLPIKDSEWEQFESWILIGGDILGRGLTIPQLTTTYFLRNSNKPNLDTVLQQMRFCGYRNSYLRMISIYMTPDQKHNFVYMDLVNRIVWNKTKEWELHNFNLRKNLSSIVYAQPNNVDFEPTRKSVQDPNLIDKKLTETTFQARKIFPMRFAIRNSDLFRSWLFESDFRLSPLTNHWYCLENLDLTNIAKLLNNWTLDVQERSVLLGVVDLFDRNYESLGFAGSPITLFVRQPDLIQLISKNVDLDKIINDIISVRTINDSHNLTFNDWGQSLNYDAGSLQKYQKYSLTAVGGSQRALRDYLEYDSTLIVIEPIKFLSQNKKQKNPIGLGLTLNILSPSGYQTRIMGYR